MGVPLLRQKQCGCGETAALLAVRQAVAHVRYLSNKVKRTTRLPVFAAPTSRDDSGASPGCPFSPPRVAQTISRRKSSHLSGMVRGIVWVPKAEEASCTGLLILLLPGNTDTSPIEIDAGGGARYGKVSVPPAGRLKSPVPADGGVSCGLRASPAIAVLSPRPYGFRSPDRRIDRRTRSAIPPSV